MYGKPSNVAYQRAAEPYSLASYDLHFGGSVAYGCYAERLATRRRDKRHIPTATDYRPPAINATAISDSTRIGVYKKGFTSKGRPIPENGIAVGLLAPCSKEPSLLAANDQHCEGKGLRTGELLYNSSGTEGWRGGVAILQASVRGA